MKPTIKLKSMVDLLDKTKFQLLFYNKLKEERILYSTKNQLIKIISMREIYMMQLMRKIAKMMFNNLLPIKKNGSMKKILLMKNTMIRTCKKAINNGKNNKMLWKKNKLLMDNKMKKTKSHLNLMKNNFLFLVKL